MRKYLGVTPPADTDGSAHKAFVESAFGGDKKAVKIDMDFHDRSVAF